MDIKETYDFSCWVIKYDPIRIPGRIYKKDSLKSIDGQTVPLIWNHNHHDVTSVLGVALLENRDEGIYAYCSLFDIPAKELVISMIQDRGSVFLSPFITQVISSGDFVTHGIIVEVSLVMARIDPNESYCPVMKQREQ